MTRPRPGPPALAALALVALALPLALLVPSGAAAGPAAGPAPSSAASEVAPAPGATTRAAAVTAYRDVQRAQRVRAGWTGSVKGCRVGRESAASLSATRTTVNRLRDLAGVRPVALRDSLNRKALAAALMMRAQGSLSHTPPRSWRCWSRAGRAAAGSSNLFLGRSGAAAMVGYTDDAGIAELGHRRWLLNPAARVFGSGSTGSSNALWVFSDTRPVPDGTAVAWPPAGFVPRPWLFADWSLEVVGGDVDLDGAQVRMTVDGGEVEVSGVRTAPPSFGPGHLVTWRVDLPRAVSSGDHEVVVTVAGVEVAGDTTPITWTTTTVDVD
ncbi:hypothetical protein GCM10009737_24340 [Nocardioides lentus]|uniref:SCP domain-containing protein n=1 Tax=Nocardioides lentus TaxID=338077 RepID=A0ABP5AT54_9ACTN